ncbi:Erf-like ssDNA annealing protein [Acinetobacter phage vB_AbaM_Highwayman]|uniref:ERF family protein n=4 Tax=Obolenskvirus TaxID=1915205 RepID=A0A1X9SFK9_9CAUD|nr:Erf-like ssDNA annealing protein [Acinetobacter phage WCHABP12]YP_009604575.1 Erf-like ssDNA annealing protein [Acinetobacter phage WCHABP1]AYP69073.1 hypothetical protein [Acinetobacter phage vB_AbaM_IME512]QEA11061.1 ERF superfamily protein [Acinetobacter phage Abp9]QZI85308.1 putative ERF family protein [Acinetobacter phage BUCT629]WFD61278.1 ERF family protein [Acinetobacter phage XC1]WHB31321.1 Erf-like ssDNA annealing protein [Acinetobacter phage P1068]
MSNLVEHKDNGFLSLMQQALTTPNMDMSILKDMLAMQKEVMAQQAVIDFNNDFAEMSKEIPVIAHTKKSYSTTYTPLEDIVNIVRPILSKYGFSVSFKNSQVEKGFVEVTCQLRHKAGHMIENNLILPTDAATKGMNGIQAIGAAISYGKRYTLCGVLNIATTADDDNNGFATNAKTEATKKPLTDARLEKAIEQVNNGVISIDSITDAYDLTPEQLIKIGREVKV